MVQPNTGLLATLVTSHITGHGLLVTAGEAEQRAVAAAILKPPSDCKQPPGRPNHTWLRAIESDLRPLNIGPFYAWKKLQNTVDNCGHGYAQEEYAIKTGGGYAKQKTL